MSWPVDVRTQEHVLIIAMTVPYGVSVFPVIHQVVFLELKNLCLLTLISGTSPGSQTSFPATFSHSLVALGWPLLGASWEGKFIPAMQPPYFSPFLPLAAVAPGSARVIL